MVKSMFTDGWAQLTGKQIAMEKRTDTMLRAFPSSIDLYIAVFFRHICPVRSKV